MKLSTLATAAILAISTGTLFANPTDTNGGQAAKSETGIVSTDAPKVHQAKVATHKSHKHSVRVHHKKSAKVTASSHKRIAKNSSLKKSHKIGQMKLGKKSS